MIFSYNSSDFWIQSMKQTTNGMITNFVKYLEVEVQT